MDLTAAYKQRQWDTIRWSENVHGGVGDLSSFSAAPPPPMFRWSEVQYQWRGKLVALVVSNNIMVLALDGARLQRIDLNQPHIIEECELGSVQSSTSKTDHPGKNITTVRRMFADPSGKHVLIQCVSGDCFYWHASWKKAKLLTKIKNLGITDVAWSSMDQRGSTASSGPFLIATDSGAVYEAMLDPSQELLRKEERYVRQVYALPLERHGDGKRPPITGIFSGPVEDDPEQAFVILTTPNRIYQFMGRLLPPRNESIFAGIFSEYELNPVYQELPNDVSPAMSKLHISYTNFQGLQGPAKSFAWMIGPGIYFGDIHAFASKKNDMLANATLFPYPKVDGVEADNVEAVPLALGFLDFHFLLVYGDRLQAICRLNDDVVWNVGVPNPMFSHYYLVVDAAKKTLWLYTESSLYEVVVEEEDRNIWKLYLGKMQFETALEHCKTLKQRNVVLESQAEYYFSRGMFLLAANYFAQADAPFETVVLKFMELTGNAAALEKLLTSLPKEKSSEGKLVATPSSDSARSAMLQNAVEEALKSYLLQRFLRLPKEEAMQRTMLATWLLEIHLKQLNAFDVDAIEERAKARRQFYDWLASKDVKESLDAPTSYGLFSSHGCMEEMVYYASLVDDLDRVISFYIQQLDWKSAIEALSKQDSLDLYYKYSPILMEYAPYETVNAWIRNMNLNPKHLIPALLRYQPSRNPAGIRDHQGIRYLEYAIRKLGNRDPAVHNFLLASYVEWKDSDEGLIGFVKAEDRCIDLQYALRLCSQHGRTHACVVIYGALGLYEEAVELALKHNDLELARINADKPEEDDSLRKRLWLKIVQHVIQEKNNVKAAMEYLEYCDLLRIEDILPFFPDFVLIDDFKDQICAALEEYTIKIDDLKMEMDEATKSAESIRIDIRKLKRRFVHLSASAKCHLCSIPLFTWSFYVFPCQHQFHAKCLTNHMLQEFLTPQLQQRVLTLQQWHTQTNEKLHEKRKLKQEDASSSSYAREQPVGTGKDGQVAILGRPMEARAPAEQDSMQDLLELRTRLKEELEELVASECIYCGELMLRAVDKPFLLDTEFQLQQEWMIV